MDAYLKKIDTCDYTFKKTGLQLSDRSWSRSVIYRLQTHWQPTERETCSRSSLNPQQSNKNNSALRIVEAKNQQHEKISSVNTIKGRSGSKPIYCGQCGQTYKPKQCPAYGQKCSMCHKLHHFAKYCRSKMWPNLEKPFQIAYQAKSN